MKKKSLYYILRLLLLSAQFFLYKYISLYSDSGQIRQFVYVSTLLSLFGLTDFGFSIYAQRLCSLPEISVDSARRLIGAGLMSVGFAVVLSILSACYYFIFGIGNTSFRFDLFLSFIAGIFALNLVFLASTTFCRIGFSSPMHGYTGSLIMSLGPMIALTLLASARSIPIQNLQNPSLNFAIGSGLSFFLSMIYILTNSPKAKLLLSSIPEFVLHADYRPGYHSLYDWAIGSLGMLTLQTDMLIVLFLRSPNLFSYFLIGKVISVFAFLSSIELPRVFSACAESPSSQYSSTVCRRYMTRATIIPLISFPVTICYLYLVGQASTAAFFIALILNIVLFLRINTDLFSCVLQACGRVRVLTAYLPFQFTLTAVLGILLGNQVSSLGVAFAQLAGFSLIAYPWLKDKYNSLLSAS